MQNNEQKEPRKVEMTEKTEKRRAGNVLLAVILAAVIIASGVFIAKFAPSSSNGGESEKTTLSSDEKTTGSALKNENEISQSGSGFPLSFSSNDIVDIEAVGSDVYVVSNEILFCISSSGKLLFSHVLNYSEPVIKSNGNYGIVFDRLSGKYVIISKKKVVHEGQSENASQILTAQVSSDGSYAIASRSNESACILTYYDRNGKEKFSWACTKDHIVSVAISSGGRELACAALSASDGEIETKVYLLDIYSDETEFEYTVKGTAGIDIRFASSSKLMLLCSDRRLLIGSKGEGSIESTEKYSSSLLNSFSDKDGYSVTLTSKFGSFGGYEIKNYSPDNSVNYVFETESKVTDVLCSGKKTYILTESELICVNSFGKERKRKKLEAAGLGMCLSSGTVYYYSLGNLYKD